MNMNNNNNVDNNDEEKGMSRLDRLFLLLSNGSNSATKNTAGRQIGEIVKTHKRHASNLLRKLRKYLISNDWDTRIAAGIAVDRIAELINVEPRPCYDENISFPLQWDTFNINEVLEKAHPLYMSGGEEFLIDWSQVDPEKRLALERKQLEKRLGIQKGEKFTDDLIDVKDIVPININNYQHEQQQQYVVKQENKQESMQSLVSSRMRNKRSRKQAEEARNSNARWSYDPTEDDLNYQHHQHMNKKRKTMISSTSNDDNTIMMEAIPDDDDDEPWPFDWIINRLQYDIFDPIWEHRHGACIGLRAILKRHTATESAWINDFSIRLICLLALDRFGDYSSDDMAAPVREIGAQALGMITHKMSQNSAYRILEHLFIMCENKRDEIRLAGYLGIKYLLAVKASDIMNINSNNVLVNISKRLNDSNEDIRGVAADCLSTLKSYFTRKCPNQLNPNQLISSMWRVLQTDDDLSSSSKSIMSCLLELLDIPWFNNCLINLLQQNMIKISIIYEYIFHQNVHVRRSAILLLIKLKIDSEKLKLCILHCFFVENDEEVLRLASQLWIQMNTTLSVKDFISIFQLIGKPLGSPIKLETCIGTKMVELNTIIMKRVTEALGKCLTPQQMILQEIKQWFINFLSGDWGSQRIASANTIRYFYDSIKNNIDDKKLTHDEDSKKLTHDEDSKNLIHDEERKKLIHNDYDNVNMTIDDALMTYVNMNVDQGLSIKFKELIAIDHRLTNCLKQLAISVKVDPQQVLNLDMSGRQKFVNKLIESRKEKKLSVPTELSNSKLYLDDYLRNSQKVHQRVRMCASSVIIATSKYPIKKIGSICKALLASIRNEEAVIQMDTSKSFAEFMLWAAARTKSPNEKLFNALCNTLNNDDNLIGKRGAIFALRDITKIFGNNLFKDHCLPKLWNNLNNTLYNSTNTNNNEIKKQLRVLHTILSSLNVSLLDQVLKLMEDVIINWLSHVNQQVRHEAQLCVVEFCKINTSRCLNYVLDKVVPMLKDMTNESVRIGGNEMVKTLLEILGLEILPYLVFLVVPLLGGMSDPQESVRNIASLAFSKAMPLIPLECEEPSPSSMSNKMQEKRKKERSFLEQLIDNSKVQEYNIPIKVNANLRIYQKEGINWLSFLSRFKLHGILCDDMGLGKTLQTICIMASRHYEHGQENKMNLPSLVVCPASVVHHWKYEINKFCSNYLTGITYDNTNAQNISSDLKNVVWIVAYERLLKDSKFFLSKSYIYCVLDEGHIIKNPKSKTTIVCKQIVAEHRLILSGTPIQNNVLELWSLFDFLMPGFLGTEKYFKDTYGKIIMAAAEAAKNKNSKKSSKKSTKDIQKAEEDGALVLEKLHKMVLPFLLRRLKEDVLSELPPKIIQDRICELSPIQYYLYHQAGGSGLKDVEKTARVDKKVVSEHIFQTLSRLRKLCSHPKLIEPDLNDKTLKTILMNNGYRSLDTYSVSSKLVALRQLLLECGIGVETTDGAVATESGHRVILFAQFKATLDLIENDLLCSVMPQVTYTRLDGDVKPEDRLDIVNKFNDDVSIDILLSTTKVGGLGLNLTGADIVVLFEHDWNPSNDLQAMDRAHRIGQKRTVNVYRLITRNTLEEKIMGIQQFKQNIANTVITKDNSKLSSMDTGQVLDLFKVSSDERQEEEKKLQEFDEEEYVDAEGNVQIRKKKKHKGALKTLLEEVGELWDPKQYEKEHDVKAFVKSLEDVQ